MDGSSGAALVIALIVMAMLSLLTVSTFDMLTINVQIAGNHAKELQASYIADAGVEVPELDRTDADRRAADRRLARPGELVEVLLRVPEERRLLHP